VFGKSKEGRFGFAATLNPSMRIERAFFKVGKPQDEIRGPDVHTGHGSNVPGRIEPETAAKVPQTKRSPG